MGLSASRRVHAAVGSAVFLVAAPGVVAGVIPWLLTGWQSSHPPVPVVALGSILVVAGAVQVMYAFARFVSEGGELQRRWRRLSGSWSEACTGTFETRCTSPSGR